jgi:hypothetical protein
MGRVGQTELSHLDFEVRIISCGLVKLVGPGVNDARIEIIHGGNEAMRPGRSGEKPSMRLSQEPCLGVK